MLTNEAIFISAEVLMIPFLMAATVYIELIKSLILVLKFRALYSVTIM